MTDHLRDSTNMHTENSDGSENGIVMFDEPIRLIDLVSDCAWWVGTAALVILIVVAMAMTTGLVIF